jgi:site-specific DNA recombinase
MTRVRQQEVVRCAVYCRVSTSMQASAEFSSIDAQRESAEALIRSQAASGWEAIDPIFEDAGFSAATTNRPALQRLLAEVRAGRVNVVIVYKLDRLSRNQRDLLGLLDEFAARGVAFKSVTQNFDTSGPMGKAMIGMLGVFGELERGMISERTRDKVVAARRRGRWTGGVVPLGYDLIDGKLMINEAEAERVRQIIALYLEHQTITATLAEVEKRGWRSKSWITKSGSFHEGSPFTVASLRRLMTSPYPAGRVSVGQDETVEGEHEGIVHVEQWEEVQRLIAANGRDGGSTRNRSQALLMGLIRCAHCNAAMTPTTTRRGSKQYRYYVCTSAQKKGWATCPSKSLSARKVEGAVIEQIKAIARDPAMITATVEAAHNEHQRQRDQREAETRALSAEIKKLAAEEGRLASATTRGGQAAHAAQRRLGELAARRAGLQAKVEALRQEQANDLPPDTDQLRRTLESFEPVWEALMPAERVNVARLLIAGVVYDGQSQELEISLRAQPQDAETEAA